MIDLATREVVGYAMADHHRSGLVVDALRMAAGRGALREGCITHSDRGAEYTSREYRAVIKELGLRQSMGRTGSCYDNAAAESFFGLLKAEIGTTVWESHDQVRADVSHFIEVVARAPHLLARSADLGSPRLTAAARDPPQRFACRGGPAARDSWLDMPTAGGVDDEWTP